MALLLAFFGAVEQRTVVQGVEHSLSIGCFSSLLKEMLLLLQVSQKRPCKYTSLVYVYTNPIFLKQLFKKITISSCNNCFCWILTDLSNKYYSFV